MPEERSGGQAGARGDLWDRRLREPLLGDQLGSLPARSDAIAATGRTAVTGAGFGVTATESVVVRLCKGRLAPVRVRVDMVPSLEMEAGFIGEALAGTILEGLPGVEGGGRYQGRRYRDGRLTKARIGGDVRHLSLPDGSIVTTANMPLGGHARREWADGTNREGWLRVGEVQAFTGTVPAEVACRLLAGQARPGAYTPAALFGSRVAEGPRPTLTRAITRSWCAT